MDKKGTFNMSGGSITGNTALDKENSINSYNGAGGVYVDSNGTFNVSGGAVVSDNLTGPKSTTLKTSNVYIPNNKTMGINGALVSGAAIGVTTQTTPSRNEKTVPITLGGNEADYSGYFISDKGYAVYDGTGHAVCIINAPVITPRGGAFSGSVKVRLSYPQTENVVIRYTTNGDTPNVNHPIYTPGSEITPTEPCTLRAMVFASDTSAILGPFSEAVFTKVQSAVAVTLNPCGGTVSPATINAIDGVLQGALPTPARAGFDFDGWFTAENGGGTRVDASTPIHASCTIYANWKAQSAQPQSGGSGAVLSGITAKSGVAIPITGGGERITAIVTVTGGRAAVQAPDPLELKKALDAASNKNKQLFVNLNAIADDIPAVQLPSSIVSGAADKANNVSGLTLTLPDSTRVVFSKQTLKEVMDIVKSDIVVRADYGADGGRLMKLRNGTFTFSGEASENGALSDVYRIKQTLKLSISGAAGEPIGLPGGINVTTKPISFGGKDTNLSVSTGDVDYKTETGALDTDALLAVLISGDGDALVEEKCTVRLEGAGKVKLSFGTRTLAPEYRMAELLGLGKNWEGTDKTAKMTNE